MTERRIIHIDMDYFFAQVEMRDNPKLKGKPVIVGGKASHRGVVSTASYEARAYGVHSAMPMTQAHKLCPNGYYVTSRFDAYREVSGQIMKIFRSYTELVEPMSLDDIYEVTRLTASAGVSYNKFLAKLASGMNKPNGLTVIDYNNVHEILMQLDIGDFPGVGKASKKKMHQHHIYTGQDLYNKDEFELIRLFGKRGRGLYNKARGIDHNEVKASRVRKSVGTERTFSTDVNDDDVILRKIRELSGKTAERLNPEIPIRLIGVTVGSLEQSDFKNLTIYDFI